jgi:hypothetical protein
VPQRILWLCPVKLKAVPPPVMPLDVEFQECRHADALRELIASLEHPYFDVVVVDTAPVQGESYESTYRYDPIEVMTLVATKCTAAPRYLIAVIKHGIWHDPVASQMAFAAEIHDLWRQRRPMLVIEEAVKFKLIQTAAGKTMPKGRKDSSISQVPEWGNIADRAVKVARNELSPRRQSIPPLTRQLVNGMCADSRKKGEVYFTTAQRDLLFGLARYPRQDNVEALAKLLNYDKSSVYKMPPRIAGQLYKYIEQDDQQLEEPNHPGTFCNNLVADHRPWLLSRYERS